MPFEDLGRKSHWITEASIPAGDVRAKATRALRDLPVDVTPGAKQVAMVTMFRAAQADLLEPIVTALRELEALPSWEGGFLVAEDIHFKWQTAPFKHYASFADFYQRELADTWGKWSDLQETYRKYKAGELSKEQIQAELSARAQQTEANDLANKPLESKGKRSDLIEVRAAQAKAVEAADLGNLDDNKCSGINQVGRRKRKAPTGTSAAAAMRRLRKDRPDIHARVLAGEMSAHAGMIEAGFRKRRQRKPASVLPRILKLLPQLAPDERAKLRAALNKHEHQQAAE